MNGRYSDERAVRTRNRGGFQTEIARDRRCNPRADTPDNREYKRPANPSINNMGRDIYKQRDQWWRRPQWLIFASRAVDPSLSRVHGGWRRDSFRKPDKNGAITLALTLKEEGKFRQSVNCREQIYANVDQSLWFNIWTYNNFYITFIWVEMRLKQSYYLKIFFNASSTVEMKFDLIILIYNWLFNIHFVEITT